MDSGKNNFGARLKSLLAHHEVGNDEAVRRLKISRASLFNWFNRELPPPSKKHRAALVALFPDEPAEYIFFGLSGGAAGESIGATGLPAELIEETRLRFERLLLAAGDDPKRLGWIIEQFDAHLAAPKHWRGKKIIHAVLPSQKQALSTHTGKPIQRGEPGAQEAS